MKAKIAKGGDDKQKQDGTEEEKKLQAKYELLRKKREEKKKQQESQAPAQDDAAGAAAAADAQPAAAAQEPVAAPTAPAAAAAAEKPAAAAAAAKQVAKEAAPAAKPAPTTKTQLAAGTAPPKKVITAAEAAARLAKSGALLSPAGGAAMEQTPARPGAGGAGASVQRRPGGAPLATPSEKGTPVSVAGDGPLSADAGAGRKRPAQRRPATEPKRPRTDADDEVSRLWGKARGESGGVSGSGRGGGGGGEDGGEERRRVVVTGLPENADDNDLKLAMVAAFGRVLDAKVLDRGGIGFVTFQDANHAEDAVEMSAAAAEGKRPPLLVSGKQIAVEWPRERQAGPLPGSIAPPGMDGAAFLMLPPELQKEHQRRLDMEQMAAVAKFYTQGGVMPTLPKGPDRDLVDYSDLL